MQTAMTSIEQWTLVGLLSSILTALTGVLVYLLTKKQETRLARASRDEQVKMHTENSQKLNQLIAFRESQERLNDQRDEQVSLLKTMVSTTAESLKQITSGLDRRTKMLEDEMRDRRRES